MRRWLVHRVVLGWAVAVWFVGGMSAQLHEVIVAHAMCPEHGVVEDVGGRVVEHRDADEIRAGDPASDHHACEFQGLPSAAPSTPVVRVHVTLGPGLPVPAPLTGAEAPRGPPLAYAPKTSPPIG